MKIGPKITIMVLSFSLIIIFIGLVSVSQINKVAEPLTTDIPNSINDLTETSNLDGHAQFIRYYDEVLTQSARNYAFTMDDKWEERYRQTEPLLDIEIKDAIESGNEIDKEIFSNIDEANLALVDMEYRAIDLVNNGQDEDAVKILESEEYWNQKKIYEDGLRKYTSLRNLEYTDALQASTEVLTLVTQNTQNLLKDSSQLIFTFITIFVGITVFLGFLIYRSVVKPIQNLESAANKISKGHNVKIPVHGNDEIHDLAESINEMVIFQNKTKDIISFSENKFRDLYENSPSLLRTIDINGNILDCNQVYAKTLGYTKKEIIGTSIFNHVPKESYSEMRESFETWKKIGRVGGREVTLQRKDGTIFPALITASAIYNTKGDLVGSNTSISDLTAINKVRDQIHKEKIKRLTAIGELSARIAHDLRNPMSVIKNTIEMVEMELDTKHNEKIKKKFERIDRAIIRINHQVEDVLDFVRNKPLILENTSVQSIFTYVLDRVNIPTEVTINVSKSNARIDCDFEKLEITFVNLITNAIQAMSNKGEINITLKENEDHVVIAVNDSGPGIKEEVLSKIFDPLFTTRQIGTGLGLASCKNIVEKHGGTIEVETKLGEGTTFVIKLPKKQNLVTVQSSS